MPREDFLLFSSSRQITRVLPWIGHNHFLSYPFQFICDPTIWHCHLAVDSKNNPRILTVWGLCMVVHRGQVQFGIPVLFRYCLWTLTPILGSQKSETCSVLQYEVSDMGWMADDYNVTTPGWQYGFSCFQTKAVSSEWEWHRDSSMGFLYRWWGTGIFVKLFHVHKFVWTHSNFGSPD